MLDYEPLALQCALLSAKASGLTSVEDYRLHETRVPSSPALQPDTSPKGVEASFVPYSGPACGETPWQVRSFQICS